MILLVLDNFKPVNDTHGHEAGDAVLKTISERLQQSVRSSDLVARLGGDEFAVILDGADIALAKQFSADIINAIEVPIEEHGESFVLSASVGIACCPEHTADANLLLKYADKAMYKAKRENLPIYVPDR